MSGSPRTWSSRGYLPHFEWPGSVQFVTFRLNDSLPRELLERWAHGLIEDGRWSRAERLRQIERALDHGSGQCLLGRPEVAAVVEEELMHFDGQRYRLVSWVVMPNHVHAVVELRRPWKIARIIHGWKWHSATVINRLIGRTGVLWQPEYFDRFIRDSEHLDRCIRYIDWNPVKAKLCGTPRDWPFGSARRGK